MFFRIVYKSGQIFLPFCQGSRVWRTDRQTDRRTDGQTEFSSLYRVCITCSAVKTTALWERSRPPRRILSWPGVRIRTSKNQRGLLCPKTWMWWNAHEDQISSFYVRLLTHRQTDKQTDRQTDKQTDRQIHKQTDRQTDRQTNAG